MIGENGGAFEPWYLFQHGWTEREIAEALGASKGAVSQWLTSARNGGHQALLSRVRGTHAKLTEEQKRLIPDFLWHGPEAYGFRGEVWTCPRVVEVLAREFGVTYHRDHVSRILKELGWTPQIPITRASPARRSSHRPLAEPKCGLSCVVVPWQSAEPWFLSMNRASTCCRAWSEPMAPKGRRRSLKRS